MSIHQDSKTHIPFYLTFFPENLETFRKYDGFFEHIGIDTANKNEFNILFPGFGLGYFEIPLIYELLKFIDSKAENEITVNLDLIDKSARSVRIIEKVVSGINNENTLDFDLLTRKIFIEANESVSGETPEEFSAHLLPVKGLSKVKLCIKYITYDFEFDPYCYTPAEGLSPNKRKLDEDFVDINFDGRKYDLIVLSFILNHISFWRSLIAYLNKKLEPKGTFIVNRICGDSLLINGEILSWKLNKGFISKSDEYISKQNRLFEFFNSFYKKKFTVLSDNWEISAVNISVLKHFLRFCGSDLKPFKSECNEITLDSYKSDLKYFKEMVKSKLFSTFTENIKYWNFFSENDEYFKELLSENNKIDDDQIEFTPNIEWFYFSDADNGFLSYFLPTPRQNTISYPDHGLSRSQKDYIFSCINLFRRATSIFNDGEFSDISDRKLSKFFEYKLDHILSLVRRCFLFPSHPVHIANFRFRVNSSKIFDIQESVKLLALENYPKIEDREKIEKEVRKYFKSAANMKNFSNLDLLNSKFAEHFHKPFIVVYTFPKDQNSNTLEFEINNDNQEYIRLMFTFKSDLNEHKLLKKSDEDILEIFTIHESLKESFIETSDPNSPGNEKLSKMIKSIALSKDIFETKTIILLPIFRHQLKFSGLQSSKDRIGAFTLIVEPDVEINSETFDDLLSFYTYLGQAIENMSKANTLMDLLSAKEEILKESLRAATVSIMIDSYAHNVSAHSLAALKWWFEERHQRLAERQHVGKSTFSISHKTHKIFKFKRSQTTAKIKSLIRRDYDDILGKISAEYKKLGLDDSTYNENYFSLYDLIYYMSDSIKDQMLTFELKKVLYSSISEDNLQLPVPVDFAVFPLLKYLRDKGAFWSGVTRDLTYGGEVRTWYQVLWEDFLGNPLYLGTIAISEGITVIEVHLHLRLDDSPLDGHFATVDLSLLDPKKTLETGKSSYQFVKTGDKFENFRKILSNTGKSSVFLPGGIIGEHALFTIIENTLRNVKHYDKLNGQLNLHISIDTDSLKDKISQPGNNAPPEHHLFKFGVWLEHEANLYLGDPEKRFEPEKFVPFIIAKKTFEPIIDNNGSPKMGGNSQDKICAAVLFNNKFSSVEEKRTERDKCYFPWIRYSVKLKDSFTDLQSYHSDAGELKEQVKKLDFENDYSGTVKKTVNLWQATLSLPAKALDRGFAENPSRAKFVTLSNSEYLKDYKMKARKVGVIRFIHKDVEPTEQDLYKEWFAIWLPQLKDSKSIGITTGGTPNVSIVYTTNGISIRKLEDAQDIMTLNLVHGKYDNEQTCNVRSHGNFMQRLFHELNGDHTNFRRKYCGNNLDAMQSRLFEFCEIVMTKVAIFDNRVQQRMSGMKIKKDKMFQDDLNLFVYPEAENEFECYAKVHAKDTNVLIMHLSFIESFRDSSGNKYTEMTINNFIQDKLRPFHSPGENDRIRENFIFIITSGRGRDDWRISLKNANMGFEDFTLFKPIESFLSAVESAISYNDNFDLKFNIVKLIFGS